MASKKHVDPLQAKARKQKIMAIVLGVVFLGVCSFEVPHVMKMMKTPPSPHANDAVSTTIRTGAPSLAAPTLRGAEQPAGTVTDPTTGGPLASSDTPMIQDGQLASFSRFVSKDPFSQQLSDGQSATPSSSSPSSGSTASSGSGATNLSPQVVTGTNSPQITRNSPQVTGSSPQPGSAVVSVNGALYTVPTASDFPQESPLFHLVSVTAHTAKISIAGGSYSTGAPTVTLRENKPVTLVNTADRTRYTLILKPLGTNVPGGSSTSSSTGSVGSGTGTTTTPSSTTVTLPSP